jgi:peptidoglycan biosynthesis protein MviN/MurJ (putative lipid II flippase)
MNASQLKNSGFLFLGQLLIKSSNFIKQLIMAFFLGISANIDILLVAQIVPTIISSMIAGGAGEILVTSQKKDKQFDNTFVALFLALILLLTAAINGIYFLTTPLFANLFEVDPERPEKWALFYELTILVLISRIPTAIVSTLQHMLFSGGKYKFYVYSSLIAEAGGILTIVATVQSMDVAAFALGLIVSSTLNAVFFLFTLRIPMVHIFSSLHWRNHVAELKGILKRVFNLGGQTFINQLSTFWERTLSSRYLQPGFLGALNYSKSLSELPKMAMLSSILTTTYIEQVNHRKESESAYEAYTLKMEYLLSKISFVFQILAMIFGPALILVFYKRGQFDLEAVDLTFAIYQILTLSFVPNLMLNFLSRTMYIEEEYNKLFRAIVFNFVVESGLMILLIQFTTMAIPIALTVGKFFLSGVLFYHLNKKKPNMLNARAFIRLYITLILSTLFILIVNTYLINYLKFLPTWQVIAWYVPIGIISILLIAYIGIRNNIKPFNKLKKFLPFIK